ncbi:tyrosine-type recombinase/integrase [Thalassotalea litorea]|uniref:tyrosine-type recombinase/integrase n=1 Tax=Thalassotalea litorea TaxID=2020715 RepID=UPI0037357833
MHLESFENLNIDTLLQLVNKLGSAQKKQTRHLTVSELSCQLGFPEQEIISLARRGELPSTSLTNSEELYFHPEAAQLFNEKELTKFQKLYPKQLALSESNGIVDEEAAEVIQSKKLPPDKQRVKPAFSHLIPVNSDTVLESFPAEKSPAHSKQFRESMAENTSITLPINGKNQDMSKFEIQERFRKNILSKVDDFSLLTKSEKSELGTQALNDLQNREKVTFNYVEYFKLPVKRRPENGIYYLNLRNKIGKVIQRYNVSDRPSLGVTVREQAISKANELLHGVNVANSNFLCVPNHSVPTLNDALRISMRVNNLNDGNTRKEMNKKIGIWSYFAGDVPLENINRDLIVSVLQNLNTAGSEDSTINKYAVEIRKALTEAVSNNLSVSVPDIPSFGSGQRNLIEIPWHNVWLPFVKTYCSYENRFNQEEFLFLSLIWHFGHRHTNVSELTFSQIDFVNKVVHFNRHKSKARIDVPLSDFALEIIAQIKAHHKAINYTGDQLFPTYKGIDRKRWVKAIEKHQLPGELVIHHVRHYFLTDHRRNGTPLCELKVIGGFKSDEGVKRYIHCGIENIVAEASNKRTGVARFNVKDISI